MKIVDLKGCRLERKDQTRVYVCPWENMNNLKIVANYWIELYIKVVITISVLIVIKLNKKGNSIDVADAIFHIASQIQRVFEILMREIGVETIGERVIVLGG